jgi:molybdate transport system substrate-binding protein
VRRLGLAAAVVALVLAPAGAAGSSARVNVFAASSLTEVFPRIDRRPGYSFGGSNQLAFQIRQGAPADVFASASPEFTRALYREGLVERPRVFASNALVLAVPRSNPSQLRSVFDLRDRNVRLVVGTESVPIGSYTRRILRRLGLTIVLDKVVSEEPDVKSIVGKLALGEADAGFVYRTDVQAASGRLRAISLPGYAQPAVRYEAAVVRASRRKADARRFVASLTTRRAQTLLRRAGFGVP